MPAVVTLDISDTNDLIVKKLHLSVATLPKEQEELPKHSLSLKTVNKSNDTKPSKIRKESPMKKVGESSRNLYLSIL